MSKMSNKNIMNRLPVIAFIALICNMLWGSAFPFIKIGYRLIGIPSGDAAAQVLFAGVRFFAAGVMVILFGSIMQKKPLVPSLGQFKHIAPLGMVQTVSQYVFFYIGLAHISGTRAAIINGTGVFAAFIVSCFIFRYEKFTVSKLLGCLVGFAGIVLINLGNGSNSGSVFGDICIILTVMSYAFSSSMIKRYSKHDNPVLLSGWQFAFGGAVMIALGLIFGGRICIPSWQAWAVLAELSLVSAVAYTLWGVLLKYNDVTSIAVFGCLNPVFGFLLSAFLLNEGNAFSVKNIIALMLVCSGIVVVNLFEGKNLRIISREKQN